MICFFRLGSSIFLLTTHYGFFWRTRWEFVEGVFFPCSFLSWDESTEKKKKGRCAGARRKNAIRASEYISRAPSNHSNWALPVLEISCGKRKIWNNYTGGSLNVKRRHEMRNGFGAAKGYKKKGVGLVEFDEKTGGKTKPNDCKRVLLTWMLNGGGTNYHFASKILFFSLLFFFLLKNSWVEFIVAYENYAQRAKNIFKNSFYFPKLSPKIITSAYERLWL